MKLTSLSLAAVLAFGGSAFAQTTTPAPGTDPAAPVAPADPATPTDPAMPAAPADPAAPSTDPGVAPAMPNAPADATTGTLTPGANSFTEEQARERIVEAGYTDVTGLVKGEDGIWRGHARRDGATVVVGVDYQGVVATTTAAP
jgi:putative membrane protein